MVKVQNTYTKIIYCLIVLLAFMVFTIIIKYYFVPIVISIFMLLTCKPIFNLLCKYRIFNKNVSAALSILIINLLIFFIIFYIGKLFINNVGYFVRENYSLLVQQIQDVFYSINDFFKIDILSLNSEMKHLYSKISYNTYIKKGAIYTTQGIISYFISNITVYFLLVDSYVIVNTIERVFPNNYLLKIRNKISQINNIFKIELILVIATTLEIFFGLIALNINNAFFLAIISGILDIVPYIGNIIVFIPLIIYNIINNNKIIAFGLILLYILLQITRQIAETKFLSNKLEIHPLILILAIYIGITSFGFIGIFMAPLFIIVTKEIIFST